MATIVSHRKLKDGFLLKLRSNGNPAGWTDRIRTLSPDKFESLPQSSGDKKETFIRCGDADIIAGIGLPSDYDDSITSRTHGFVRRLLCTGSTDRMPVDRC
jgi:hypothetical protein